MVLVSFALKWREMGLAHGILLQYLFTCLHVSESCVPYGEPVSQTAALQTDLNKSQLKALKAVPAADGHLTSLGNRFSVLCI